MLRHAVLLVALVASCIFGWARALAEESPVRCVLSQSGLKLRDGASRDAKVLAVLPYGTPVDLPEGEAPSADGWRQVRRNDTVGYVLGEELATVAPPDPGMEVAAYAVRLREAGGSVLYEKIERDWGGYLQAEEAVVLPTTDMREAFRIARVLFGIPAGIPDPPASAEPESKFENPDKAPHLWSDELVVTRDPSGQVTEMSYVVRGEGGGVTTTISPHEEGIRLATTAIAD